MVVCAKKSGRVLYMTFRAVESIEQGRKRASAYLIGPQIGNDSRRRSLVAFEEILDKYGPVVEAYPSWHPMVGANNEWRCPIITPRPECGYQGLDHTILLAHGFITCPYVNAGSILESVQNLPINDVADIDAEELDVQFYHPNAKPVLVTCQWRKPLQYGLIPKKVAVPLMLQRELPQWQDSSFAETWETMRPYFLGQPHGGLTSLFLEQDAGAYMKRVWNQLINSGAFGPIRV